MFEDEMSVAIRFSHPLDSKNKGGYPILFTLTTERAFLSRVGGFVEVLGVNVVEM
jgi:hypothetical protein